jgi:CBS-domain-containing membrane protein
MNAIVQDVMTSNVIWVERDTPFAEMAALFRQNQVSAFPVLNEARQVIGVVSEADLMVKEALGCDADEMPGMITAITRHKERQKARGTTAAELMTAPAFTVSPDDSVARAARQMYLHRLKSLPVVDAGRCLVGIISRVDVLSVFGRPDEEIRQEALGTVLVNDLLVHPETIGVSVKNGVVTLTGVAEPARAGHDIVHGIRSIEGVVSVRDQLSYAPRGLDGIDVLASFPVDLPVGAARCSPVSAFTDLSDSCCHPASLPTL